MNTKAVSRTSSAIALIVIIVAASLIGVVYYYTARPSGPGVTVSTQTPSVAVPDFVKSSTYTYETGSTFDFLDPAIEYHGFDAEIDSNVYEHLLQPQGNSSTAVIPWLAESYQKLSPTKYQFKLRQGITFQDGTPFNAQAVWFNYNRLLVIDGTDGTGTHGIQSAWIIQQMLDVSVSGYFTPNQPYDAAWVQKVLALNFVEIVDPYTININIKYPTSQFESLLSTAWVGGFASPSFVVSHDFRAACKTSDCAADSIDYTAYFNHIAGHGENAMNYLNVPTNGAKAGTGPYYIDSINPTTYQIVLKANPKYWGGPKNWNGPPITLAIKTVEYLYVPDTGTRILDLKAGKASGIEVSSADLYSIVDRNQWVTNNQLVSAIPGVTVYGTFPLLGERYVGLSTNVTDIAGHVLKFQPFADIRFRLAVASAVNLTDIIVNVANKLPILANEAVPPGTAPEGSYDPNVKTIYNYDLTRAENLLLDAQKNPLTKFVDYNGHPYPLGVIDNSFGPRNPQVITLYAQSGDTTFQRLFATIISNLNAISTKDNLGLTFTIALIPGGQQYTLATKHIIYGFQGHNSADYNYVLDWMGFGFSASGGTPGFVQMNLTAINNLYSQMIEADRNGDVQLLVKLHSQLEQEANNAMMFMYTWYDVEFDVRTSFLRGFFYNPNFDYMGNMAYYAVYSYASS